MPTILKISNIYTNDDFAAKIFNRLKRITVITNTNVELFHKFIERWKMLIWNPVFIWFQSFVFETAWLSFFQVTITWKTTKCANTCLNFRQKHDSQVVINFNQFHSPLESCQEWNLSPFQVCTIASTDPIFNSKEWLRIYLP